MKAPAMEPFSSNLLKKNSIKDFFVSFMNFLDELFHKTPAKGCFYT